MTRANLGRGRSGVFALLAACGAASASLPWPAVGGHATVEHANVRTLNQGYARTRSHVLVRQIDRPTHAALDYAAYHANFMIAEPPPDAAQTGTAPVRAEHPFAGTVERASLTADIAHTGLRADEQQQPLAFAPLVELLLSHKLQGADALEALGAAVRSESWGQPATPGVWSQAISEAYLHDAGGAVPELWVKIELAPWFHALGALPDQDADGVAEVYARARSGTLSQPCADFIRNEYASRVLSAAEVKAWANQLSSYWYPSFNTDLAAAGPVWPDDSTEAAIKHELGGHSFEAPAIVLRGKPQGVPTYEVFLVDNAAPGAAEASAAAEKSAPGEALVWSKTQPTPQPAPLLHALEAELTNEGGGSFEAWAATLKSAHAAIRKRLATTPARIKALAGNAGFLFYRNSLDFVVGGDLEQQPPGKNPLPIIVELKRKLDALGVDFLFVPVPTKLELFPDRFDPKLAPLVGKVLNPFERKLLASLAKQGVEVVDLLAPMLAARAAGDAPGQEPLYQPQDTHWTARGLQLAADALSARVKQYPWYAEIAKRAQSFSVKEAQFTRFGDLQSRLPQTQQKHYQPDTLIAHQVLRADGSFYDDDPESPIVVLGDSFTGVYELTDAEHAGLSAQLARGIGYPVDLVMSYGGGPNVRSKLMRRGVEALARKKLVIWVMAARDLYNYWEDWAPLERP